MVTAAQAVLVLYACWWITTYWKWWPRANLPAALGGDYDNPFNDPKHFCCVYGAPPCPVGLLCTTGPSGKDLVVLQVNQRTVVRWACSVAALVLTVVELSTRTVFPVLGLLWFARP